MLFILPPNDIPLTECIINSHTGIPEPYASTKFVPCMFAFIQVVSYIGMKNAHAMLKRIVSQEHETIANPYDGR